MNNIKIKKNKEKKKNKNLKKNTGKNMGKNENTEKNKNTGKNENTEKNENTFRNKVDLMYLTNANNLTKLNNDSKDTYLTKENIEKYKASILMYTKKILNEEFITSEINNSFENYVKHIIKNEQLLNKTAIIQKQYKDINKQKKKKQYKSMNISEVDVCLLNNEKKNKTIDLTSFVKKTKHKRKHKIIIPMKQNFS